MEKEDKSKKKLGKWLDKLQQESWQLELVVSGFAIFLMAGAWDALVEFNLIQKIKYAGLGQTGAALGLGYLILSVTCLFIMINLVLHVLLRGLWISTIGLRYVSGDIDFEKLKLAPRFKHFLRKRIGSFDEYILRLENICSVIFAFTFLVVFMLVGLGMFFLVIILVSYIEVNFLDGFADDVSNVGIAVKWAWGIFLVLVLLSAVLYFIDFVTLGYLKRKKWLSRIYFPIYRFYSLITLSSLYRPMYYNLVDNKFGRRVGFLLVPYLFFIMFLLSFEIRSHVWFNTENEDLVLQKSLFDDQRLDEQRIFRGSIPSKYLDKGYLELFIAYNPNVDDEVLDLLCPGFHHKNESGVGTDLEFSISLEDSAEQYFSPPDSALTCLSRLYEISVADSVFKSPTFYFHEHQNDKERGLLTILDLAYLPRGPQVVKVRKLIEKDDELILEDFFSIPFWIE